MSHLPTIGLFGTCGGSRWRERFISEYQARNIPFYNPQVQNWTPACAEAEAHHLHTDNIILFPVTGETYGLGSLTEVGFAILQASRDERTVVVLIDPQPHERLRIDKPLFEQSVASRALVLAHMKANPLPNVFPVSSLDRMLIVSLMAYDSHVKEARMQPAGEGC
jgi:hypothetical protein